MTTVQVFRLLVAVSFALLAAGAGNAYRPQWQPGDAWKVCVTYTMAINRQKIVGREFDELVKTTKLVFPYPQLFDYETKHVEYWYRVKSIDSNGIAEIDVEGPASNRYAEVYDWKLYFNTNRAGLVRMSQMWDDNSGRFNCMDPHRPDCYYSFHNIASILNDNVDIPLRLKAEKEQILTFYGSESVLLRSFPDANGVTVTMTRTNALDGLDRKITIRWDKGKKWWSSAREELGTNLVKSAVLVE